MKLIEQNPFRMLGIPVNASAKDLAANKSKFRLLDIGKEVAFPTDLTEVLPPTQRTKASVDAAEHSIALPHDKVLHALFWIAKPDTPLGKLGYEHLMQGMTISAIREFSKCTDWPSHLCLATLFLQREEYDAALQHINYVIEKHCNDFVYVVTGQTQTHTVEAEQLRREYLTALTKEINASDLYWELEYDDVPEAMLNEVRQLAIDAPLRTIEKAIATANAADKEDAEAQLKAGQNLMNSTKTQLQELQQLLDTTDMRYSRTADKLANTIMQCSINYFNKIDSESHTTLDNALELAKYAARIAEGKMAKEHIKHNLYILKKKRVEEEDSAIKALILKHIMLGGKTIDNAIALMKACAPHIVAIYETIEYDISLSHYSLSISTQVVNTALSAVIEELNKVQHEAETASNISQLADMTYSPIIQTMLKKAWKATLMMDKFDKEEEFRERYVEHRAALLKMCDDVPGVNVSGIYVNYSDIDLRTEKDVYYCCRTSSDYRAYISRYPSGKYLIEARQQEAISEFEEKIQRIREQQERERKQREEQRRKEEEHKRKEEERKRKEHEREQKVWIAVLLGSIILGVIICVESGTGWGILVVDVIVYCIAKIAVRCGRQRH